MHVLTLALLTACEQLPGETWEPVEVVDEGWSCLEAETADQEGTVYAALDDCLSSSCDRNAEGSCEATLEGDTITVTSTFTWETATGAQGCTDDCGLLDARCTVGPLAKGSYTLTLGGASQAVEVPTSEPCSYWQPTP